MKCGEHLNMRAAEMHDDLRVIGQTKVVYHAATRFGETLIVKTRYHLVNITYTDQYLLTLTNGRELCIFDALFVLDFSQNSYRWPSARLHYLNC